ncbi:MAG: hypothetical protein ABI488_19505 [Polyangiaceae bacterium]
MSPIEFEIITAGSAAVPDGTGALRVQANCPAGEHILGGGYEIRLAEGAFPNNEPVVRVQENRPFRVQGGIDDWLVSGINLRGEARDADVLEVYAVCTNSAAQ